MKRMEELSVVLSLKGKDIPSLMKELLLKVTDSTLLFFSLFTEIEGKTFFIIEQQSVKI